MKLGYKAEKIYSVLLSDIARGNIRPGERMPTEQELCLRFDASRNTIRNVFKKLYSTGRVVHHRNVGSYVVESGIFSNVVSLMCHGNIDLIIRVQNMLLEHNYIMNLFSQKTVGWSLANEADFLGKLLHTPPKALLASCTPYPPYNKNLLNNLVEAGTRVIHFEPYSAEGPVDQEYLMPDYRQAGYAAVTSLLLQGCKRIVFLAAGKMEQVPPFSILMEQGCRECLDEQGVGNSLFIRSDIREFIHGGGLAKLLGESRSVETGIFADSSSNAFPLRDAIREMGCEKLLKQVTVKLLGDSSMPDIDYIDFDRDMQFHRIITSLNQRDRTLKDYVKPKVVKGVNTPH